MATAQTYIDDAHALLGVTAEGASANTNQTALGLRRLNDMLDSWSLDPDMVYDVTIETFNAVSGTAAYTIGSTGTWGTTRPIAIVTAYARIANVDSDIEVVTERRWAKVRNKATTGSPPTQLFYQRAYPNGTVNLAPTPNATIAVYLTSRKPLATFALSSTTASFPPGYPHAIVLNLAKILQDDYGFPLSKETLEEAVAAMNRIKAANLMVTIDISGITEPTRDRGTALNKNSGG